jgi:phosphate transport system substrate-binding protein
MNGKIDMIFDAEASQDILSKASKLNIELDFTPFALDGFVFIANKENMVDNLDEYDVQNIYEGKIKNWKEV